MHPLKPRCHRAFSPLCEMPHDVELSVNWVRGHILLCGQLGFLSNVAPSSRVRGVSQEPSSSWLSTMQPAFPLLLSYLHMPSQIPRVLTNSSHWTLQFSFLRLLTCLQISSPVSQQGGSSDGQLHGPGPLVQAGLCGQLCSPTTGNWGTATPSPFLSLSRVLPTFPSRTCSPPPYKGGASQTWVFRGCLRARKALHLIRKQEN